LGILHLYFQRRDISKLGGHFRKTRPPKTQKPGKNTKTYIKTQKHMEKHINTKTQTFFTKNTETLSAIHASHNNFGVGV